MVDNGKTFIKVTQKPCLIVLMYVNGLSCKLSDSLQASTLQSITNRNCFKSHMKNVQNIKAQVYPL